MGTAEGGFNGYAVAARTCVELVDCIAPDRWPGPGLGDWDLRALVGHTSLALINVTDYVPRAASAEDIVSAEAYYTLDAAQTGEGADATAVLRRGRQAGTELGSDPGATFRQLAEAATATLAAGDPDRLVETIAGGIRAGSYVATRTVELVVHGLDIARALGIPFQIPAPVLAQALEVLARTAVERGLGIDLLVAVTGRGDLRRGFSVV